MPTTAITDRIFGKRRLRQTWQPGLIANQLSPYREQLEGQ